MSSLPLLHLLPTARWTRRRHDWILAAVLTTTLVGLVTETFLRISGLLPLLPRLDFSVLMFGFFVTVGVGGTLLLALTAPAERHQDGVMTRAPEPDLRDTRPTRDGDVAEPGRSDGSPTEDDSEQRELVSA